MDQRKRSEMLPPATLDMRFGIPHLKALIYFLAIAATPCVAQMRPTVIKGATVLTGDGRVIERGSVMIQGGKIAGVGKKVDASLLARKVSARGKFVTPGLIDVWSGVGLRGGRGGSTTGRAADGFDRFAKDEIEAALRQGITAVYIPAYGSQGVGGLGAVVRMQTGAAPEAIVLEDEVALCTTLSGRSGALRRLTATMGLRAVWQGAKDYREAWDDYEEELEEYEKKLKERAEKKDAPKGEKGAKGGKKKSGAAAAKKEENKKPAKEAGKDKKKDELKKPAEPAKDRNKELLLRAIDGEIPWRVDAHRPDEILNVLEVAEEFNLRLIIEGASGAHLVAKRLAEAEVPVVLDAATPTMLYSSGSRRFQQADAVRILKRAGVEVYLGSGPVAGESSPTRHLALRAALAVGQGFDADEVLETITSRAARLLGVEKSVGRIARGRPADLVIWSAHPLSPGAKVERVFANGEEVYNADDEDED